MDINPGCRDIETHSYTRIKVIRKYSLSQSGSLLRKPTSGYIEPTPGYTEPTWRYTELTPGCTEPTAGN